MRDDLETIREALSLTTQHVAGYDWNADPLSITLKQSAAFEAIDRIAAALPHPDNPKPQTFEAAMMAYEGACAALRRALVELGRHT